MEKHPKAPANNKRLYGQNAAVALKYNPDMNYAPVVVASGLGELAQRIVNIADEAGETIPKELYQIVAAIYAEVVYTANDMRKK